MRKRKLRFGVPREYNINELEPVVRETWLRALKVLHSYGHTIHPVSLPTTEVALSAYYIIAAAEASSNLAKYDGVRYGNRKIEHTSSSSGLFTGTRGEGLGKEVKKRILLGSYSLSAGAIGNHFIQAQKVRRLVQEDFNTVFRHDHPLLPPREGSNGIEEGVDFLITPTSQSLPPTLESLKSKSSVDTFADDALTVPASLAGLPALTVPVLLLDRRPAPDATQGPDTDSCDVLNVGIQVIGQYSRDMPVLDMGRMLFRMLTNTKSDDFISSQKTTASNG